MLVLLFFTAAWHLRRALLVDAFQLLHCSAPLTVSCSPWQGSPMLPRLLQRKQQLQDDFEALLIAGSNDLEVAKQHRAMSGVELVTLQTVTWAAATLLSRAFSLDLNEEEPIIGE